MSEQLSERASRGPMPRRKTAEVEPAVNATELALTLLRAIAEDAGLRGSHRVRAREHFRQLARLAAGGPDDER